MSFIANQQYRNSFNMPPIMPSNMNQKHYLQPASFLQQSSFPTAGTAVGWKQQNFGAIFMDNNNYNAPVESFSSLSLFPNYHLYNDKEQQNQNINLSQQTNVNADFSSNNNATAATSGRNFNDFVYSNKVLPVNAEDNNKMNDLVHVNDPKGVVDYLYKSCSGKPYGGSPKPKDKSHVKEKSQKSYCPLKGFSPAMKPGKPLAQIPGDNIWKEFQPFIESEPSRLNANQKKQFSAAPAEPIIAPRRVVSPDFSLPRRVLSSDFSLPRRMLSPSFSPPSAESDSDNASLVTIPVQELIPDTGVKSACKSHWSFCKNYIGGNCSKKMCKFLHAKPLHVHRDQIIFLGGLPKDVDRVVLYEELIKHNIPVINLPMVIDKFTPRVVLKTKEIAKFYIEKKLVKLFGKKVDVRSYKQSNEVFHIFLGGLHPKTTVADIEKGLKHNNCSLMNIPTINKGYCINVEVASRKEQQLLFIKGHITVLGQKVEVKQINKRKRKTRRKRG